MGKLSIFIKHENCPISYLTVVVDRKEAADKVSLSGRLARWINEA